MGFAASCCDACSAGSCPVATTTTIPDGPTTTTTPAAPQTHTVMGRIRELLAGFGLSMDEVVKVNAFFKSGGTAEELNANLRVRSACFTEPGPATTGISLPSLAAEGLMIDVEVTAMPR